MDSQLEKDAKTWFEPATKKHSDALKYLQDLVRNIKWEPDGVRFDQLQEFTAKEGVTVDMVRAIGFKSLPHFLYHCFQFLEVRSKVFNGETFYYLLPKGNMDRKGDTSLGRSSENVDKELERSLVAPFSRVLNLHRGDVIPPMVSAPKPAQAQAPAVTEEKERKLHQDTTVSSLKSCIKVGNRQKKVEVKDPLQTSDDNKDKGKKTETVTEDDTKSSDALTAPIVKIKRTFVFEPPEEGPGRRYAMMAPKPRIFRRSTRRND